MKQCHKQAWSIPPVSHAARDARGRVRPRCCSPAQQASSTVAATLGTTALRPHAPVALQSFTFNDESQIELSYLRAQVDELSGLRAALLRKSPEEQVALLQQNSRVQACWHDYRDVEACVADMPVGCQAAVLATIGAGQQHVVCTLPDGDWRPRLQALAHDLEKVQTFYDSLGGIVGYQVTCLELIVAARAKECSHARNGSGSDVGSATEYLVPQGTNLQGAEQRPEAQRAAADGLRAMPELAEIYPLGGAGDRLGLVCDETGEPLPAAMLPYCGRTMFEGLLRDLQAREYLHWRLFGTQLTTPVAIMTSDAKGNHRRVCDVLEASRHFGRPKESFRLFNQPLVPVLEAGTGEWVLPAALRPSMKPGGHGAIWKLMHDHGVFEWLEGHGRKAALIRQISNPMASTDFTLLALAGVGHRGGRAFGFASCNRCVGAAEGMNVLREERVVTGDTENADPNNGSSAGVAYECGVTNVEYTEFQRLGISDQAVAEGSEQSAFPANTNILYVGLREAADAVRRGVADGGGAALPGMIFNLKKQITYTAATSGETRDVQAGRMECTMQALADSLTQQSPRRLRPEEAADLRTFVVFNERRYVTSSAKRARAPGSDKIHQTPEGSFLDLMRNARDLLAMCGVAAPELGGDRAYVDGGCAPAFVWLWHPALGPLWQVAAQKVRGGSLAPRAEVCLELAELRWLDVAVEGSLRVAADNVVGHADAASGIATFSDACGRARFERVRVENAGVDYGAAGNCFWRQAVARRGSCTVLLRGRSEFDARDVTIAGDVTFEVPDGHRLEVRADASTPHGYSSHLTELGNQPSWQWRYDVAHDGGIELSMHEAEAPSAAVSQQAMTAAS